MPADSSSLPRARPLLVAMRGQPADSSSLPRARPLLAAVRGQPAADELAAVVVVLAARARRAGPGSVGQPQPRSEWSAQWRMIRPLPTAGPGAWRASGLPRS
jgi:hypothetical protein